MSYKKEVLDFGRFFREHDNRKFAIVEGTGYKGIRGNILSGDAAKIPFDGSTLAFAKLLPDELLAPGLYQWFKDILLDTIEERQRKAKEKGVDPGYIKLPNKKYVDIKGQYGREYRIHLNPQAQPKNFIKELEKQEFDLSSVIPAVDDDGNPLTDTQGNPVRVAKGYFPPTSLANFKQEDSGFYKWIQSMGDKREKRNFSHIELLQGKPPEWLKGKMDARKLVAGGGIQANKQSHKINPISEEEIDEIINKWQADKNDPWKPCKGKGRPELPQSVCNGAMASYNAFYKRNTDFGHKIDPDDFVQEVMLRLTQNMGSPVFRQKNGREKLAVSIARSMIKQEYRKISQESGIPIYDDDGTVVDFGEDERKIQDPTGKKARTLAQYNLEELGANYEKHRDAIQAQQAQQPKPQKSMYQQAESYFKEGLKNSIENDQFRYRLSLMLETRLNS